MTKTETKLTKLAQSLLSNTATVRKGQYQTESATAFGNSEWRQGWYMSVNGENHPLGKNANDAETNIRWMASVDYLA